MFIDVVDADWRLIVDGETKSVQLEKERTKIAGNWETRKEGEKNLFAGRIL
jgi:hypothetical protein